MEFKFTLIIVALGECSSSSKVSSSPVDETHYPEKKGL